MVLKCGLVHTMDYNVLVAVSCVIDEMDVVECLAEELGCTGAVGEVG